MSQYRPEKGGSRPPSSRAFSDGEPSHHLGLLLLLDLRSRGLKRVFSRRETFVRSLAALLYSSRRSIKPGGSVHGERVNLTVLVLGWIDASDNESRHFSAFFEI